MPYEVRDDHPDCPGGYAVVLQEDRGDMRGCHDTRGEAEAQVAALYANEADA